MKKKNLKQKNVEDKFKLFFFIVLTSYKNNKNNKKYLKKDCFSINKIQDYILSNEFFFRFLIIRKSLRLFKSKKLQILWKNKDNFRFILILTIKIINENFKKCNKDKKRNKLLIINNLLLWCN